MKAVVGEAVVGVELAGVCGTDLHIHDGGFFAAFPLTPGHEMSGGSSPWGGGSMGLEVGQRVVIDNAPDVGTVAPADGRHLFCENSRRSA